MRSSIINVLFSLAILVAPTFAQEEGGEPAAQPQGSEDLRAKVQNPVGSLISVPFQNNFDFGAPNGTAYILNIQPVIPFTIGEVNLINRVIVPVAYVPGFIQGLPGIPEGTKGDGAFGLGDINYTPFLSSAKPGKVIWGVGPSISFDSATDDLLGTGKWSAGPSAVVLIQPKPWTLGVLGRQLWSFAGDSDRSDVNQFLLEPFVNYNLEEGWFLISDMIITANWDARSSQRWTVPIGGGLGKLLKIGNQPINTRLEAYWNAARPDSAPDWALRFTFAFLFPK